MSLFGNPSTTDFLNDVDQAEWGPNATNGSPALGSNSSYKQQPTVQQAANQSLVGTAVNPMSSMNSAWQNSPAQQAPTHMSQTGQTDDHFQPPDQNGIRRFNDAGAQHASSLIPDNSGLITSLRGAPYQQPQLPGAVQTPPPMSLTQAGQGAAALGQLTGSSTLTGLGSALGASEGAAGAGAAGGSSGLMGLLALL